MSSHQLEVAIRVVRERHRTASRSKTPARTSKTQEKSLTASRTLPSRLPKHLLPSPPASHCVPTMPASRLREPQLAQLCPRNAMAIRRRCPSHTDTDTTHLPFPYDTSLPPTATLPSRQHASCKRATRRLQYIPSPHEYVFHVHMRQSMRAVEWATIQMDDPTDIVAPESCTPPLSSSPCPEGRNCIRQSATLTQMTAHPRPAHEGSRPPTVKPPPPRPPPGE